MLSDKHLPHGRLLALVAFGVVAAFALLTLLAMSPALAFVGLFAGAVCLTAVRDWR